MQNFLMSDLTQGLSAPRLNSYATLLEGRKTSLNVLSSYLVNMYTTAQLTYSLQLLEVTLRNNMHDAFTKTFGAADWYDTPGLLGPNEAKKLSDVRQKFFISRKPNTPNNIVAESSFGFWAGMLHQHYENKIYRKYPSIIKQIFPYCPRYARQRAVVAPQIQSINKLRNRALHWEPIKTSLKDCELEIGDLLKWLNPSVHALLLTIQNHRPPEAGTFTANQQLALELNSFENISSWV